MKRLLLIGGGHAHLGVLRALAARPIPGWRVQLVSPEPQQIYSGMLPGWISGHYAMPEILLPVAALATNAGAAFHQARGVALDLAAHALHCDDGARIAFDAVSLDVGSVGAIEASSEAAATSVPVRPLSRLAASWLAAQAQIGGQCSPFHVVIVGAGAAGVELALAVRHRGMREGWSHLRVTLVGSDALPLEGAPLRARRIVHTLLAQRCIGWLGARRATSVHAGRIDFDDGGALPFDLCWSAAGAAAPRWLASSGLALDADGFVRVNAALQSVSHPAVFAAGDVAAHPHSLPRSGVHAVRAGAPLARSLRAYCTGQALPAWTPRLRALNLLSTADERALALWGPWCWRSAWAWRWKDAIDRRFVGAAERRVR